MGKTTSSVDNKEVASKAGQQPRNSKGQLLPGSDLYLATKAHKGREIAEAKKIALNHAPAIMRVLCEQAELGDTVAAKTVLGFILPQLKSIEHKGIDPSKLPKMVIEVVDVVDINSDNS